VVKRLALRNAVQRRELDDISRDPSRFWDLAPSHAFAEGLFCAAESVSARDGEAERLIVWVFVLHMKIELRASTIKAAQPPIGN
jgi:hypothetical protein